MHRVAEAARRAGKHWGRPVNSMEEAQRIVDLGARYITYSSDLLVVKEGLQQIQRTFSTVGFSFAPSSREFASVPAPTRVSEPHFSDRERSHVKTAAIES